MPDTPAPVTITAEEIKEICVAASHLQIMSSGDPDCEAESKSAMRVFSILDAARARAKPMVATTAQSKWQVGDRVRYMGTTLVGEMMGCSGVVVEVYGKPVPSNFHRNVAVRLGGEGGPICSVPEDELVSAPPAPAVVAETDAELVAWALANGTMSAHLQEGFFPQIVIVEDEHSGVYHWRLIADESAFDRSAWLDMGIVTRGLMPHFDQPGSDAAREAIRRAKGQGR